MSRQEWDMQLVREYIEQEGFDYCFEAYSDFSEIPDPEFHKLRKAYLSARKALDEYVGEGL